MGGVIMITRKPSKLPKIINQDAVIKILEQINRKCWTGTRNYAIVMMLYRAGLRVQELCNLTLPDINFDTGLIYVQQGKGNKDRYVPMDKDNIKALKKWLEIRPEEGDYLFCTRKNGQLDQRYVRDLCYRLSEKAGIYIQDGKEKKPVSPHKFRHTCFSELLREGTCNIREIQQLAGHKSLDTTMIYTHVIMDEVQKKIIARKPLSARK
jgi:site-specific recombinase XerD